MSVRIRIDPGAAGGGVRELEVSLPVVTIGRDPGCTVVLSDPQKHVSRFHATIHRRDDKYLLTVGSKVNPVEVNGRPCGFGQSVDLTDGDTLAIPPFTMHFRIVAEVPTVATSGSLPSADDLLGTMAAAPPASSARPSEPDPLDLGKLFGAAAAAPAAPAADPFLMSPAPEPTQLAAAPELGSADPLGLDAAPLDPIVALDRQASRPAANSFDFDFDGLAGSQTGGPGAAASGSLAESLPNPLVDLGDARSRRGTDAPDHVHDFNLPYTPPPVAAPPPPPPPLPPAEPRRPVSAPARAAATDEQTVVEGRHGGSQTPGAFLAGLGVSDIAIPRGEEEAFLRLAGEITRTAVEGIMALLSSRGEMKKELRAPDRTMLAAHNNNPLKLMADAQEALHFLFDPGQRPTGAFMAPTQAMQDACDDILAHEIGLVAGTRAAVEGAIRRFDPAQLEKSVEGEKGGGLLSNRRARLWDLYVERYRSVELDMADNIDRLFERDFLRAYSEQVRRLRRRS